MADYTSNKVTDINAFYPDNLKNDFISGLNETIFNRFLTKPDYQTVIGAIGDENLTSSIRNILESSQFAQEHQLQPVLTATRGATESFLTWSDFVRKLEQQDVDVDSFDVWGAATQFNWVPPINLDKFINYKDYYWDANISNTAKPNYVTIENIATTRSATLQQMLKTASTVQYDGTLAKTYDYPTKNVSLYGNVASTYYSGLDVIVKYANNYYDIARIVSSTFNILTSSTDLVLDRLSDYTVKSISSTELPCTVVVTVPNTLIINSGNYTDLFAADYIFSVIDNDGNATLVSVASSTYNETTNATTVTLNNSIPVTAAKLSMAPILLSAYHETVYELGYANTSTFSADSLYQILWAEKENKLSSNSGLTYISLNRLTDNLVNFTTANVAVNDTLIITTSDINIQATITGIDSINDVSFMSDESAFIFTGSSVAYKIYTNKTTSDYAILPASPSIGDVWLNVAQDSIAVYVDDGEGGFEWVDKVKNFSVLNDTVSSRKVLHNATEWSSINGWIHKAQLQSISDKIRAQLPIIEFKDTLSLADMSEVTHDWSYRANGELSFTDSSIAPTSFELFDIVKTDATNVFQFVDANTILFAARFGNMTDSMVPGSTITLSDFQYNNGTYEIVTSEYTQTTVGGNKLTRITVLQTINNLSDRPINSRIAPTLTSHGDQFVSPYVNWRYDGINDVVSTSKQPAKNDIYSVLVNVTSDGITESKYGYNWQAFRPVSDNQINPTFDFAVPLHSYCLYDDYQEGDIRVYINKKRQYGNFIELPSYVDDRFVGGISFIDGTEITINDVVLVEVGEYANIDAGRKSMLVNTPSGYETTNISRFKKIEQLKTSDNQYPEFIVVNSMTKERHTTSSKIFSYLEDAASPVNPYMLTKLALSDPYNPISFKFEQHLKDGEKLLAYEISSQDGPDHITIWKVGSLLEKYVPTMNEEGDWDIPNQWAYNHHHKNKGILSYNELYTHFRSIIQAQHQIGVPSTFNTYFADYAINYGVGGTIKEHNGNFDILAATTFNDTVSVTEALEFSKHRYTSALSSISGITLDTASTLFAIPSTDYANLIANISSSVLDTFESNSDLSFWFGDSSSFDGIDGVRNWVPTLPMMSVVKPVRPYSIVDTKLGITQVIHHDGHRSTPTVSAALKEYIYSSIMAVSNYTTDVVASDAQPFPTTIEGIPVANNDYLMRTNTVERTRTLYRYSGSAWERISIVEVLTAVLLYVEEKLYNISMKLYNDAIYDQNVNNLNAKYDEKLKKQFLKYTSESGILDPMSSKGIYSTSNPYTWNYFESVPTTLPFVGAVFSPAASFQQIYINLFNTPYPHLEPWALQGYTDKPLWWDSEYYDVGTLSYLPQMWENIFDGIVPTGYDLPSGVISTGAVEVRVYAYLPVVTSLTATSDGLAYGSLLPPYWDSAFALGDVRIRSVFDPNDGDEIASSNLDATFGQYGPFEYQWTTDIDYNYSKAIVNFKLDPMNFVSAIFGYSKYTAHHLELHQHCENIQPSNSAVLHGETVNGAIAKFCGLNELYILYNRYSDYDSENSLFNSIWKSSDIKLSYLFDSVIDTLGFDISSTLIDISNNDYSIAIKKTENHTVNKLDALVFSLIAMPSKYIGDTEKGWTLEVSTIPTEKTEISYNNVQNYQCVPVGNNMVVDSHALVNVDYTKAQNAIQVDFVPNLTASTVLNWTTGVSYEMTVTVGGVPNNISILGEDVTTVDELIIAINTQLTNAYFDLYINNLVVYATVSGATLAVTDTNLLSSIPGYSAIGVMYTVDATFDGIFYITGNKTSTFIPASTLTLTNSTVFNGQYTVNNCTYDYVSDTTLIEVNESVTIPNTTLVIDGVLSSDSVLGLPDSWVTGYEVYFNSYNNVGGLSTERPYYIIRNSATSFAVAETEKNALNGVNISLSGVSSSGALYVGKLERTFKSNGGASTNINWRVHAIDDRVISYVYDGVSFTGMQNVVDFLTGFSAYNINRGFTLNNNYNDFKTGRPISWQVDVENLIDWCFAQRGLRQESKLEYDVFFDSTDDSINFVNSDKPLLGNGSTVLLLEKDGAALPVEFTSSDLVNIPYYIVNTTSSTAIKLAKTSYDATRGIYVTFTQPSSGNIVLQTYTKLSNAPAFLYAPFSSHLSISHATGLLSDIFTSGSYVYGISGELLSSSDLFISRRDGQTDISLLGKIIDSNASGLTSTAICGGKFTTDTYEHILTFNAYTASGGLIYDAFLGLATPRFVVNFNKQKNKTLRPTLGGYTLLNGEMTQNIESAVDDSRYYYDDIAAEEHKQTTMLARQALGYTASSTDYMSDIGLTDKTQFMFWKGMIQNKGTNVAAYAFTNQVNLSEAELDEFWAYKVATFGGAQQLAYPEMKLLGEDVDANELRLEFVAPNNAGLYESFKQISMTDASRWYDQPDQITSLYPYNTLFFTPTVQKVINNVEDRLQTIRGLTVLLLDHVADGAIITHTDINGIAYLLSPNIDYEFISSSIIAFTETSQFSSLINISVSTLTYDTSSQNVSKIIDRKEGNVVSNVPFWNPAIGQYDNNFTAPISKIGGIDPAVYTNTLNATQPPNNIWLGDREGFIWMDTYEEGYVPYFDPYIIPDIDDRIFNWGKHSDWSKIEIYQWTASSLLPEARDKASLQQTNELAIPDEQRITGTSKKLLYANTTVNMPTPTWVHIYDQHFDFTVGTIDENSAPSVVGDVEVYVNGIFKYNKNIEDVNDILYLQESLPLGFYVHLILRAHVPTKVELQQGEYKYATPYVTETRINKVTGKYENVYYYWVSGKHNTIAYGGSNYTLNGIRNGIVQTSSPYMVLQGLRTSGSGYGLVYGNIFDEFETTLPYRYTQMIIKGLSGKIKAEDRYTLRFTKDYNLRDTLSTTLQKKNVHVEWKMFREKQSGKVDRYLWDKMVESVIGYKLTTSTTYDNSTVVPALYRQVYDNIYGTDTRIGMENQQTFCDKDVAIATIHYTIDAMVNSVPLNVAAILETFDASTPESAINSLNAIYTSIGAEYVNSIFFAVMYDALVLKREHRELFKTSWVAIQASQDVPLNNTSNYVTISHNLVPSI